jgi:uncharacterized DUF497 family protein
VEIEYDPAKDEANIAKHGVSLALVADLEILTVEEDLRVPYPEPRLRAFGLINGMPYCLAYTLRGPVMRAISLRRAHIREFRRHVP